MILIIKATPYNGKQYPSEMLNKEIETQGEYKQLKKELIDKYSKQHDTIIKDVYFDIKMKGECKWLY